MGDVANITRSRGSGYSVLVLVLVLSILGSPLALGQRARARTDVIHLKDGDRVTGEIKELDRGLLRVRTNTMGTVDIEWEHIERVTSNYEFEIELGDGQRYVGSLLPSAENQYLDVTGEAGSFTLEHISVVRITQLENVFWKRWEGSLDAGFSFARANRVTTWNLGFVGNYRLPQYLTRVSVDSYFSKQQDIESVNRHTFKFDFNRYFSHNWFINFPVSFQHNSELNLDLRSSGGVGLGRDLIQTNRSKLWLTGGGIFSRENFPDGPSVNSVEGMASLKAEVFTYDFPNLGVIIGLTAFPSLSNLGRIRLAFVSEFSYEFFRDFVWKVKMFDDFDSDPRSCDAFHPRPSGPVALVADAE